MKLVVPATHEQEETTHEHSNSGNSRHACSRRSHRGGNGVTGLTGAQTTGERQITVRMHLLAEGRLRCATLVSLLAYSGLRPGEALALTWERIGERTIAVTGASSMGRLKGTKTGAERTVRLLSPLAQDLAEWRLGQGRPDSRSIVFPGESQDGTLTEGQWNRWTQGAFRTAKLAVGLHGTRAYDLRHSFVSLLIHEGQSILEVARQAGHSPQTCLRDYGHLFDEFDPAVREPAEAMIRAARDELVPLSYLSTGAD